MAARHAACRGHCCSVLGGAAALGGVRRRHAWGGRPLGAQPVHAWCRGGCASAPRVWAASGMGRMERGGKETLLLCMANRDRRALAILRASLLVPRCIWTQPGRGSGQWGRRHSPGVTAEPLRRPLPLRRHSAGSPLILLRGVRSLQRAGRACSSTWGGYRKQMAGVSPTRESRLEEGLRDEREAIGSVGPGRGMRWRGALSFAGVAGWQCAV